MSDRERRALLLAFSPLSARVKGTVGSGFRNRPHFRKYLENANRQKILLRKPYPIDNITQFNWSPCGYRQLLKRLLYAPDRD